MSKTITIDHCLNCPHVVDLFGDGDYYCGLKTGKQSEVSALVDKDAEGIPTWCPLPDTQEQGWQDIATAPEDTLALLFNGEDIGLGFADKKSEDYGATHWMPLPPNPKE